MYSLPYFKENDFNRIRAFMEAHPFVLLSGVDASGLPVATQVPVLIREAEDGSLILLGHIMRGTDHYKAFLQKPDALCVFTGPHVYVSASWYTDPRQGSTWNYMSVHAKGKIEFLPEAGLRQILKETTALFENDPTSPALFEHLSEEYVGRLVKAIAGFSMNITAIENVFKLSQNRDEQSYLQIIEKLQSGNEDAQRIAMEMKERFTGLYPTTGKI